MEFTKLENIMPQWQLFAFAFAGDGDGDNEDEELGWTMTVKKKHVESDTCNFLFGTRQCSARATV